MNLCLRGLYACGVWIKNARAERLSRLGLAFLDSYTRLAKTAHRMGLRRFGLIPKLHFCHHLFLELLEQSNGDPDSWSLNPLSFSVQMQEDYIGRPSRVSRRVTPKAPQSKRTLQSVLLAMYAEYQRVEER